MSDDNEITFRIVVNDNSNEAAQDLIALNNIFSRQLPKMPKAVTSVVSDNVLKKL